MKDNNQRAFVFIDGNNFYFKLRELSLGLDGKFSLLNFNFREFSKWLVSSNELKEIHYYIGALKRQKNNEKSEKMYANQQKLIGKLQQQKVYISFGQLIQHPDKTFHEKGVDVRLAVEMIRFARQDKYDVAYLLSSDTDLVAAVEEVQLFGKKVQYVGIAKGQSFGLTKAADDIRLLRPEDIQRFF
ncbi:MAG: NYN domain-containing protein [bacterium]|nr:NYN domain-containing protein [bacterium]